jgi:hypothetical protein
MNNRANVTRAEAALAATIHAIMTLARTAHRRRSAQALCGHSASVSAMPAAADRQQTFKQPRACAWLLWLCAF